MIVGIAFKNVDILPFLKDDLLPSLFYIPKIQGDTERFLIIFQSRVAQQAKAREQPLLLTEEAEMVSPLFPPRREPVWPGKRIISKSSMRETLLKGGLLSGQG